MDAFYKTLNTYRAQGDGQSVEQMLQVWRSATDPEEKDDLNREIGDAFQHAISTGDESGARMMLDAGIDPTTQGSVDPHFTPLLTAARYGRRELARRLWEMVGPDGRFQPSRNHPYGGSPSCLVVAARNGHAEMVADFLGMWDGWWSSEKREALVDAAGAWCDDVVALLLARIPYEADIVREALDGAVGKMSIPNEAFPSRRPGKLLPDNGPRQYRLVCRLIDSGANPNWNLGSTLPIHTATSLFPQMGSFRALLEKGANPGLQDKDGKTALHIITGYLPESKDALLMLVDRGASLETPDVDGVTPRHLLAYSGTLEIFLLCLERCSNNAENVIRSLTRYGESLLHYAAAGGKEDIVGFLLDRGLDVNMASLNRWTPLLCALVPGQNGRAIAPRVVRLLLQRGASAQVVTNEGWTPLHALATSPNLDGAGQLAEELIALGTSVDAEASVLGLPRINNAYGLYDVWGYRMHRLLADASLTQQNPQLSSNGKTPLAWATRTGATAIVDILTKHFASRQQ
ncbi:ankyrin repeat-containing domain protein [Rhypophila decipiens]|uniref:Ankyrin repeat-containing domain protein n=1 Tax=Rhypophila decipiens TaxID=261697 RepID=A0AAN6Y8Z6_9PEZI|nr:ankyrin repeat-containing domain protein [Rhypophila decipiens]